MVLAPDPPCAWLRGVVKPDNEVMSLFAPDLAADRLPLAEAALLTSDKLFDANKSPVPEPDAPGSPSRAKNDQKPPPKSAKKEAPAVWFTSQK